MMILGIIMMFFIVVYMMIAVGIQIVGTFMAHMIEKYVMPMLSKWYDQVKVRYFVKEKKGI